MATSKSPEEKLKRLIYLCNTNGKYYCGGPQKNKPERASYVELLNNYLKNNQDSLLKILENASKDKFLPHKLQMFNILATLITLEAANEKNKPTICQLVEKLCTCDKDLFDFIWAVSLTQDKDKRHPHTVIRIIVRFYKKKTAEDLTKSFITHKGYHGWTHQDIIKLFHVKSETPGKACRYL